MSKRSCCVLEDRTMLDKARVALAAWRITKDPNRLDEVLEAVTRLAKSQTKELEELATWIAASSPHAEEAMASRRMMRVEPDELARCAEGSLGHAVHAHCAKYGIHPRSFPERPLVTRGEYVIAHIENTHDVWHPVVGFGSDPAGEIGLQAFYLAQFPNHLALLLLGIAPIHMLVTKSSEYPRLMDEITRGWTMGKRARSLFGIAWDEQWDRPLVDIRRELAIAT
jgi:ubiquinone biosynthesis protein COQ4